MANFIRIGHMYYNIDQITTICIIKHEQEKFDELCIWTSESKNSIKLKRRNFSNIEDILAVIIHSK